MKKRTKKLELHKETVQRLKQEDMRQVAGGFSDVYGGTSCYPVVCNIDSDPC